MNPPAPAENALRLRLLGEFLRELAEYARASGTGAEESHRSAINRMLVAVSQAVKDAGVWTPVVARPPAAIGGPMASLDPFKMVFRDWYGQSFVPQVADMVEQAIGVYENLDGETGLVRLRRPEAIDIEGAIERALRPSFRGDPPQSEREVQDRLEDILNSIGVDHVRESEVAVVGPRSFKPDFTVPAQELAIEVKLAREGHGAGRIQEELAADIAAYGTKWKRLLVVIYDVGVIKDPHQMRRDNMKHFGVTVLIIKH